MAAFVQGVTKSGNGTTSAETSSAFSLSTTSGDLIIVSIGNGTTNKTVSSVTDSKGNTYSQAITTTNTPGRCSVWYALNITGGSAHTVTVTISGIDDFAFIAQQFSGLVQSNALDKTAGSTGVSSSANSGSTSSTIQNNELIIGSLYWDAVGTISLGDGFLNLQSDSTNGNMGIGMESITVSSASTYNATFSKSASGIWICNVSTFKLLSQINTIGSSIPGPAIGIKNSIVSY